MTLQADPRDRNQVTVYVENNSGVPFETINQAEALASSMFALVAVKINWRRGQPMASATAVAIKLAAKTPASEKLGARAYSKPYEGVHIVVFWDRMKDGLTPAQCWRM